MKPSKLSNQFTQLRRFSGLLISLIFTWFALCLSVRAVVPPPDGGYPDGNTAEGESALFSLTTGRYNTAVGFLSLRSDSGGSFNTAVGAGTLLSNGGDQNTATGAGALLATPVAPKTRPMERSHFLVIISVALTPQLALSRFLVTPARAALIQPSGILRFLATPPASTPPSAHMRCTTTRPGLATRLWVTVQEAV
jgi:hypothetical protein